MPPMKRDIAPARTRRSALAGLAGAALSCAALASAALALAAPAAGDAPAVATYRIRAAIATLDHWVFVRQVLLALPGQRGLDIVRLAPDEAEFDYRYAGDAAALTDALAEKGLALARDGAAGWTLAPVDAPAAPPPPGSGSRRK